MPTRTLACVSALLFAVLLARTGLAQSPDVSQGDYVIHGFTFRSGESLPELRVHYRTLGAPARDAKGVVTNAVLVLHGTTGSGANFIRPEFSGELFGKGQPLDAARYYIIIPDDIGHGGSSKPSDGLHGKFPRYGYRDMIEAERRLVVEGLKVDHLRLVMGTSMGGMHTWLWAGAYPDLMNAALPLASLPVEISGRNRVWRQMISDAIRTDPEWNGGEYANQPRSLRLAAEVLYFVSSNPTVRFHEAPTGERAAKALADFADNAMRTMDATDVLYAVESSRDYDPEPLLESIKAPLLAINFADDLINPPGLGILEREIGRVKKGKAVVIPESEKTRGHGTHTLAAIWKQHLVALLAETER